MKLQLLRNVRALAVNLTTPLAATGGVPPYIYSVLPDGAGGSIDPVTGFYTSASVPGTDTVQVVDSVGSKAQAEMYVCTPLELFCDILQRELQLARDQVYLQDSKIQLPTDSRLYVAVGVLSCDPYGNKSRIDDAGNEIQTANVAADLSVDIFSKSSLARERKEEIILALKSNYSRQQQELNSFYVAKLPSAFVNLSQIEGSAIPHRFNITITIHYCVTKTRGVAYYDDFGGPSLVTNP